MKSRLLGEILVTSDRQMTTTLMAESEELKSFLIKLKEESEKVGLKLNRVQNSIQKLRSRHLVPSLYGNWMGKQWKQ